MKRSQVVIAILIGIFGASVGWIVHGDSVVAQSTTAPSWYHEGWEKDLQNDLEVITKAVKLVGQSGSNQRYEIVSERAEAGRSFLLDTSTGEVWESTYLQLPNGATSVMWSQCAGGPVAIDLVSAKQGLEDAAGIVRRGAAGKK